MQVAHGTFWRGEQSAAQWGSDGGVFDEPVELRWQVSQVQQPPLPSFKRQG